MPTRDLRGWAWNFSCEGCEVQGELNLILLLHFYLGQPKLSPQTLTHMNKMSDGLWAGFISLWGWFSPSVCSVFPALSAPMAAANPISSIPCSLSLATEPKKSAPKSSRCWSTILTSTRTSRAALWRFTSKKSLTRYVWVQLFFYYYYYYPLRSWKTFWIFAYFCWSWGKLCSVISLPLGCKTISVN